MVYVGMEHPFEHGQSGKVACLDHEATASISGVVHENI